MYVKVIVPFLAVILVMAGTVSLGGPEDADIHDAEVQNALKFAMAQYNIQSNGVFMRQISEVIKVQKQVVEGMKYIFTVISYKKICSKGGVELLCEVPDDLAFGRVTKCEIQVWSRPWLKSMEVLKNTCM